MRNAYHRCKGCRRVIQWNQSHPCRKAQAKGLAR